MALYKYFEDLRVGEVWETPARTVTESDVVQFACLTGDMDPLHVDRTYAAQTPYGRPMAHGLLGLAFLAGLGSHFPAVRTLAFLEIREWKFLQPVFPGDTIHAKNEIVGLARKGRRAGQVSWSRKLINQENHVVQAGYLETLVAIRAPGDDATMTVVSEPTD